MTDFLTSLLTQLLLVFVAGLSSLGAGSSATGGALATLNPPRQQTVAASSGHDAGACPTQADDDSASSACAAAQMRWQLTLHGWPPRRCVDRCSG